MIKEIRRLAKLSFILCVVIFLAACSSSKQELLDVYQDLLGHLELQAYDKVYNYLDKPSKAYVEFMCDPKNRNFDSMNTFGKQHNKQLTTLGFYQDMQELGTVNNSDSFIKMLRFSDLPLLSVLPKPTLVPEQTSFGKENYVVIAYPFQDLETLETQYLTSQVKFNKDDNGEWKVDIFPLFRRNEALVKQKFLRFQNRQKYKQLSNDSILKLFFEDPAGFKKTQDTFSMQKYYR